MRDKRFSRVCALSLSGALVGWSFVSPRLPSAWRVVLQAGVGGLPCACDPGAIGIVSAAAVGRGCGSAHRPVWPLRQPSPRRPRCRRYGCRWPSASFLRRCRAGCCCGSPSAPSGPRRPHSARRLPQWVRVPSAKPGGRLLQAAVFGLSHIADARATGEPVVATVLVTGVGGWLFGWLADRSGSLAAPMLVHLAINEACALTGLAAMRRQQKVRIAACAP